MSSDKLLKGHHASDSEFLSRHHRKETWQFTHISESIRKSKPPALLGGLLQETVCRFQQERLRFPKQKSTERHGLATATFLTSSPLLFLSLILLQLCQPPSCSVTCQHVLPQGLCTCCSQEASSPSYLCGSLLFCQVFNISSVRSSNWILYLFYLNLFQPTSLSLIII